MDQFQNLQNQINQLKKRLDDRDRIQLVWPLDQNSIKALEKGFDIYGLRKIMGLLWRKIFYYTSFFQSTSGYNTTGTVTIDGNKVSITTGAASGNSASFTKSPDNEAFLDFGLQIFARFGIQISSIANVIAYAVVGQALNATGDKYFGFKILNNTLYGVCSNNGTNNETALALITVAANTVYEVEARFFPRLGKLVFFFQPNAIKPTPNGVITSNFPTGVYNNFHSFFAKTTENVAKTLKVSYIKFIQSLNVTS